MIDSRAIERAEKTLQVVYGGPVDRQLQTFQVEREAFDKFLAANVATIKQRYGSAYRDMDPRLEPAWMTLMLHMFLIGLVCGHNEIREIT